MNRAKIIKFVEKHFFASLSRKSYHLFACSTLHLLKNYFYRLSEFIRSFLYKEYMIEKVTDIK